MTDEVQVDWEKLKTPPEPFRLVVPDYNDIEFHKKIIRLKDHLMNKYLETSDEYRNEPYLDYVIKGGFLVGVRLCMRRGTWMSS